MNIYQVQFDGQSYFVEAECFSTAIGFWKGHVKLLWGDDYDGDEEPESVTVVHDEAIIQTESKSKLTVRLGEIEGILRDALREHEQRWGVCGRDRASLCGRSQKCWQCRARDAGVVS